MVSDRMTAVLELLRGERVGSRAAGSFAGPVVAPGGAGAAAHVLGVDGISARVGTGPGGVVLAWGRDEIGVALEDLQFTLGQGPGLEAVAAGVPVLAPDLLEPGDRWPAFAAAAGDLRVRAVFAFPLRIGAISVGVLLAHRATPGPLADARLADALALAEAVTVFLVQRQLDGFGPASFGQMGLGQNGFGQMGLGQAAGGQVVGGLGGLGSGAFDGIFVRAVGSTDVTDVEFHGAAPRGVLTAAATRAAAKARAEIRTGNPLGTGVSARAPYLNRAPPETYWAEVHQATGMIKVQLGVSLAEALVRLRARAYADDRPVAGVAADVVARRLRFDGPNR